MKLLRLYISKYCIFLSSVAKLLKLYLKNFALFSVNRYMVVEEQKYQNLQKEQMGMK